MKTRSPRTATPRLIPLAAIADESLRARAAVVPDLPAGARVERPGGVHRGDVHHAVDDDRRDLQRALAARHREHPLRRELRHVVRVDLVERTVAVAAQLSVVGRPLAGLRSSDVGESCAVCAVGAAVPGSVARGVDRRSSRVRYASRSRSSSGDAWSFGISDGSQRDLSDLTSRDGVKPCRRGSARRDRTGSRISRGREAFARRACAGRRP